MWKQVSKYAVLILGQVALTVAVVLIAVGFQAEAQRPGGPPAWAQANSSFETQAAPGARRPEGAQSPTPGVVSTNETHGE